ncbi:MAG: DUF2513 domain-containing protein [Desulfobacula sp.]|uniref:DUF2513 domain-containing protein n=1 Tax=Desulfobacula sp. TaxID=2593537 RepID=UPI0025BEA899|nr:DUF2513 domain-containing protein [Desulfobacula sp.]MCD4719576.1 DUF2513 domain-containing protein [Desulfobacula sp.]
MKRDLDLIRKLLIYLEEKPDDKIVQDLEIEGYTNREVQYHFILMNEAGLIRCEKSISSTSDRIIRVYPNGLTWQGHEFFEASRNDTFWKKAKELVKSKSGALQFDVIKAVLISMAKESVGL